MRDVDAENTKPLEGNSNGDEITGSQEWRLNPDRSWTEHVHNVIAIGDRPYTEREESSYAFSGESHRKSSEHRWT